MIGHETSATIPQKSGIVAKVQADIKKKQAKEKAVQKAISERLEIVKYKAT